MPISRRERNFLESILGCCRSAHCHALIVVGSPESLSSNDEDVLIVLYRSLRLVDDDADVIADIVRCGNVGLFVAVEIRVKDQIRSDRKIVIATSIFCAFVNKFM